MSFHGSDEDKKDVALHTDTMDAHAQPQLAPSAMTTKAKALALAIAIGGFLFGYDVGYVAGCLIMPDFINRFGSYLPNDATASAAGYVLTSDHQGQITALLGAGTFFGALFQAPVSDFFGRKPSMIIWSIIYLLGAIIQTSSERAIAQLLVGRLVAGLGVGALSGLCPLYLGETAPKHVRGTMISVYQLMIITGIVLSYGICWATAPIDNSASWRVPVGLQCAWGAGLVVIIAFLPESPRWKLQKGKADEARVIMKTMRGTELVDTPAGLRGDYDLEGELAEMQEGIDAEARAFAGRNYVTAYFLCFSTESQVWKRTLHGMFLQTFQQLNGQNFYYYYGPTFFKKAAVSLNSYQIQFILGAVSWVATWPALYTIEKVGRRKSLLVGSVGCAVCAFIVAFVGRYGLAPENSPAFSDPSLLTSGQKSAGNAFIAFAVFHLVFFSCFWGPTPWVYLGESFPQHIRAKSISLGSASNWFWNFMLGWFSPGIAERYNSFIMLIFGGILIVSFFYVYFLIPETKGLTLEQVDEMYESRVAPWKSASWQPSTGRKNRNDESTNKA